MTVLDILGLSVGLDLLLRDFSFFVFGLLTRLGLDFGLGLGFTVSMSKYTRYKFPNSFVLQLTATFYPILSDKNSRASLIDVGRGGGPLAAYTLERTAVSELYNNDRIPSFISPESRRDRRL